MIPLIIFIILIHLSQPLNRVVYKSKKLVQSSFASIYNNPKILFVLSHFWPMFPLHNVPFENARKPRVFWCSLGENGKIGQKEITKLNASKMPSKHFLRNSKTLSKKLEPAFWPGNKSVTRVKIKTLSTNITAKGYTWFLLEAYLQAARNNVPTCHVTLYVLRMYIRGIASLVGPAKDSKNLWPFDA